MRIVITGANFRGKGAASMLISTSKTLKHLIPNLEFVVASENLKFDSARGQKYRLRFFDINIRHGVVLFSAYSRMLREIMKADLVVDLSGFSFTDHFGSFQPLVPSLNILQCKLFGKRFVMYSQAMGPFKSIVLRLLARFFLQQTDLIVVRGEMTKDYLYEIGIEKQVHVYADCAFLLQPAPAERVREIMRKESIQKEEEELLVGVSVNARIYERCGPRGSDNTYVTLMAQIVDYLVEKLKAKVVFIPYEIGGPKGYDDKFVAREIYIKAKNKHGIKLIENEYSAEESKALIGNFDLFIGCRFHSVVASTSIAVPTIAIAWSHKYYETMKMLGQEKYVCHFKRISQGRLICLIEDALSRKEQIKEELKVRVEEAKLSALESATLLSNLLRHEVLESVKE